MRDNPKHSLLAQADVGLSYAVCYLLGGFKHMALWLLGLIAILYYSHLVFEYCEGLADVSQYEWAFMLLALLLAWRHCRYARHLGYGFWHGLARGLTAQGVLFTAGMTAIGLGALLTWVVAQSPDFQATADALDDGDMAFKAYEILGLTFVLLALYLGAPTRSRNASRRMPVTETTRPEPSISSTPDKKVAL